MLGRRTSFLFRNFQRCLSQRAAVSSFVSKGARIPISSSVTVEAKYGKCSKGVTSPSLFDKRVIALPVSNKSTTTMSMPDACCTLPPVSSDYVAEGSEFSIGDLKVYETKDKSPKVVLICVYDIFGFHPNTKQFADKLNSSGVFRVVMPDVFRGKPWDMNNFPPKDRQEIIDWVGTTGSWDKIVKNDVENLIAHYKKEGATAFGIFGFCYGGKMSILGVGQVEDIKAAALLHGSFITPEDVEAAKGAVLFLPTKDEPDNIPFYETVKKNLGEDKAEHHRFEDMFHGFAAARGDWTDETQRKRADEAIKRVHHFFKKHLVA